jgi:uncharacterized membrane protein YedE/YeeE
MRELIAGLTTGFILGLGLCFSRMTDPAVVQGFLDVAGAWDPTLLFVMAGGVAVTFLGYRLVMRRPRPLWATKFSVPGSRAIDVPLLGGAAIFGVGWGLAGYCPGPAVVSLASGRRDVILFVIAMLVGMTAVRWMRSSRSVTMRPAAPEGLR